MLMTHQEKLTRVSNPQLARHKRKPPRGMYLDHEDLLRFSSDSEAQSEAILKSMDDEIVALKRLVSLESEIAF